MDKILAIDIETTGLDPWRDQIYMCGIYDGRKYTCLRQPYQLRNLINTLYKDYDLVGHRTDFDIKFLLVQGWLINDDIKNRIVHDTRLIGSLMRRKVPQSFLENYEADRKELNKTLPKGHSHREGSPLSLKVMAPWYLKVPRFWETPGEHNNEEYNEKDCLYTYRLYKELYPRLVDEGGVEFYRKLLQWQGMLMNMEMRGIAIDMNELDKVEQEYTEKRDALKKNLDQLWVDAHETYYNLRRYDLAKKYQEMEEKALVKAKDKEKCRARYKILFDKAVSTLERDINYSSPAQMSWLLKEFLELDITDPEGEESTGKAVLNKLASEGREDIKTYLEWREADKVLTMYLPTYRSLQVDGVIHPNFNLAGTRTGRTSSSNPNLQQVPPKLYRLFSPRPQHKFVQYDLSGIEAALIALYSGDKKLYEILEKGESIHDHNAKALFNLECNVNDVSKLHPKERKCAKTIGFACFYGAGWRRIKLAFQSAGFILTEKESKEKLASLKSYYPQAFSFHKEITELFENGETIFNLLGRPITLQPHENPYMQGFNTLIQSSASDLNLEACWRFYKDGGQPLLVIHDCIMAEAAAHEAMAVSRFLEKAMTNFTLLSDNGLINLKVDGGVSDKWEK